MGPSYAGTLGLTALLTVLIRGALRGSGVEGTVLWAGIYLFIFAAVGYIMGRLADHVITESVRVRFNAELESLETLSHSADEG